MLNTMVNFRNIFLLQPSEIAYVYMFSIADSSIKNDHKLSGLKQHYFIL